MKEEKFFLIEELLKIQEENELHYIPEEKILELAKKTGRSPADIHSVISFYPRLSDKPRGKYLIRVCENLPCHIEGAQEVIDAIKNFLDIDFGQSTPDGKFYLERTSCLGLCAAAPVILINNVPYGNLTPEKVVEVLKEYMEGDND
ncbi:MULTISPECIES: NADH-quinone oxidoreductase subunit NuoE family protein [unclassified Desulfurobacterium]|uniref:NADH-quinone oxidoreductase subunit NuoE family protein n=1 Tax=unclassified Desulfurobacterium TaxID=2639089 RepID=UPI0003B4BB1F|nr:MULTISPECIES: NAD(P)H-dependent oxidoreductase subunit E [unclassified Desulfurobacterium]